MVSKVYILVHFNVWMEHCLLHIFCIESQYVFICDCTVYFWFYSKKNISLILFFFKNYTVSYNVYSETSYLDFTWMWDYCLLTIYRYIDVEPRRMWTVTISFYIPSHFYLSLFKLIFAMCVKLFQSMCMDSENANDF